LDDTGKQIGIIDKQEALKMAQAEGKDLVEIAGKAVPPVVKLIDFKKFKYLESKKEKESRKASKNVGMKEIRLSPFIGEHDLMTKLKQAEEFLKEGNQVKVALPFRGREITRKEFGFNTINKAIAHLASISKVSRAPSFEGRVLVAALAPSKKTE
jgi:translation initiation factor IF-3